MNSGHANRVFTIMAFVMGIGLSFSIQAAVREYWIAAEKTSWNYAPSGQNLIELADGLGVWGQTLTYTKYRYIGYADGNYANPLPQPASMGILGPQLRAVVGDTLKVHFLNRTDRPLSMHLHGVRYDKDNEGADGGAGASVAPGARYTYTWVVDAAAGPGPADPSSIVWLYHSHVMGEEEMNLGLVGTLVITRKGMARSASNPMPRDVDQEFTALFMIFNEEDGKESGLKHTINGRIFGNLDGYEARLGKRICWVMNKTTTPQTALAHDCRTDAVAVLRPRA